MVTASFDDPGTSDSHTCKVDWKDGGRPTTGTVTGSGCRAAHVYDDAGIHRPAVTVTDDDAGTDTTTLAELIVYDRSAGPAAGAGTITSPAGAYPGRPGLTGKAAFTLAAQYRKGATVPTGKASFVFGPARLTFRSTGSDWLVVNGSQAVYQGTGTVGGKRGYAFRVTATDGPDTFRIKIWKKSTGDVLYDNRTGATTKGTVTIGNHRR